MAELLTTIGQVVTSCVGWIGSFGTAVQDTPMLLVGVVLSFVGVGIGLLSRLLHL